MTIDSFIGWLYWDPPREAFRVPLIDHPVVWYGILFVTGFIFGYFIFHFMLTQFLRQSPSLFSISNSTPSSFSTSPERVSHFLCDRLCWFIILGTLIGARLGAVFFYDWPLFRQNPIEVFKIWHGGLASHGGVVGVMIALYLFSRYVRQWMSQLTFLRLLDYVAVPSALVACFIRLGNFMNQEILGVPTTLPWGIIFGHPIDDHLIVPRHPVQLYEALAYLIIFFILWKCWKQQPKEEKPGALVGLLFILIFTSRFILEFLKTEQPSILDVSFLQMGQLLSLPFIALGFFLFCRAKRCIKNLVTYKF